MDKDASFHFKSISFIIAEKPSDDKTHVDYIPTLFSHVSSLQKKEAAEESGKS